MKKHFLLLITLFAVSLLALAEMTIYVYKKDGTKVPYVASTVDSIGFVNAHSIVFNANGGVGRMDVICAKEGESITLPVNSFTKGEAKFVGWNTKADGSGTAYADQVSITPTSNITLYAQWKTLVYEYVDLGLTSGTLWATMNVGADSPEDYGDYFAWGETKSKETYDWSNYKWGKGIEDLVTKYCDYSRYGELDFKTTLELSDDAAYVNWGVNWRMPTIQELEELLNECIWTWTTYNGVNGYKIKSSKNGNSIFLPAAGAYTPASGLILVGSHMEYWSGSLVHPNNDLASVLGCSSDDKEYDNKHERALGASIRPVLRKSYTITFDANGGNGIMEKINVKEGESVTLPANSFTKGISNFTIWNTENDGSGVTFYADNSSITPTSNITLYAQWDMATAGVSNGSEWVDLGLPSGTKWATCNVGADSPEDYGDYFAWGETITKSAYDWTTYKWCEGSENSLTKYTTEIKNAMLVDNKEVLEISDDAANANWGGSWRMPTDSELEELLNTSYTAWIWITHNGVNGYKVKSKINGNSIFLPAAGHCSDSGLLSAGSYGCYWSSSLSTRFSDRAYYLYLNSDEVRTSLRYRCDGSPVRPVLAE